MIIEINDIFEVKYFPYKLAAALGHNQSDIINQDLHNIFPKELRENHKKVILKNLLIENNFKMSKKTFAFTSNNKILPIKAKLCSFPNFLKNLSYIINIELLDENDKRIFYFILCENFNFISIDRNLERFYSLDYSILQKLNADILSFFDISHSMITNKFITRLKYLYGLNEVKSFFSTFYNIFNLNLKHNDYDNLLKPQTHKMIRMKKKDAESSTPMNSRIELNRNSKANIMEVKTLKSTKFMHRMSIRQINTSHSNTSNMNCILKLSKEKKIFINSLEKIKIQALELDLGPEHLNRLEECISILRLTRNFSHFGIKIQLRNFIDTPYYIVRIHENTKKDLFLTKNKRFLFFKKFLNKIIDQNKKIADLPPTTIVKDKKLCRISFMLVNMRGR
jgi:hypothetical protein